MQCERENEPHCLLGKRPRYSFGGSGAPPTCRWLKSRSVALSSSLMPLVKFGSFSRWLRADSGIFCSTRSRCLIACLRSGAICCHFGSTSLRTWSRCCGVILCQTCALSRNSCCCCGRSCLNRFSSLWNLWRSSGVRSRERPVAFGGRFSLKFGRWTFSPLRFGGRLPPSREFPERCGGFTVAGLRSGSAFLRSGCALRASCCGCRRSCLCSCLRCWFCCCLCSFGGLFS